MNDNDRGVGCLLGLALGDAFGALYEGGPIERLVWWVIGRDSQGRRRWTDDTQMSLDLAESLVACGRLDPDDVARRFAESYRWSRGYGPGAAKVLKRIRRGMPWAEASRSVYADGSYGNGAAMRAPVIGIFFRDDDDELRNAAELSAKITHAHPAAIASAVMVASSTAFVLRGGPPVDAMVAARDLGVFTDRIDRAVTWLEGGDPPESKQVARQLGNEITAERSCVTALYVAARFAERPLSEMLAFVRAMGGDVDTIGAMAGALWGAHRGYGALPPELLDGLEQRERLEEVARQLR